MTDEFPHSIASAKLTIMGVELTVHNLSNGERIIEGEGLHQLLEAMAQGGDMTEEESMKLAKAIRS